MADTITAIASLLWPILILVALLAFRAPLARVVRSAEQREWTLEVGGQKLTVSELNEQQTNLITDLQKQLGALHQTVEALTAAQPVPVDLPDPPETVPAGPRGGSARASVSGTPDRSLVDRPFAVLWVDDHPENNAWLVEQLRRNGVRVDLARSTQEGLSRLAQRRYRVVMSDMGRSENSAEVPDAGLRLLKAVRQTDQSVPFLIHCSREAVHAYGKEAIDAGATEVTASPYQVTETLRALELL